MCSLSQWSTEWCCRDVCIQRRTGGLSHAPRVPVSLWSCRLTGSSLSPGGTMAQQVPVQAIQVHQAPQQTSPSSDSSTDLTQTSSSGTGIGNHLLSAFLITAENSPQQQGPTSCSLASFLLQASSIQGFLTVSQAIDPCCQVLCYTVSYAGHRAPCKGFQSLSWYIICSHLQHGAGNRLLSSQGVS